MNQFLRFVALVTVAGGAPACGRVRTRYAPSYYYSSGYYASPTIAVQQPTVVYQQQPTVVYQQQPAVVYQQPVYAQPQVVYQQPTTYYYRPTGYYRRPVIWGGARVYVAP
jgi:hypothetical protein